MPLRISYLGWYKGMIITVTTVIILVLGMLSIALSMYGGFVSSQIIDRYEEGPTSQAVERKYYLLGMIGTIVLLTRILIVPIYFWMLQSLVPYCPGAMCASGVVNVSEPYSFISLILKILLPFVYGIWLLVEIANRRDPTLPFTRTLTMTFLVILLPLLVIDSAADVLLTATIQPVFAPCCSSIYDVDPPFSPSAVLGPEVGIVILAATVLVSLSLSAFQWLESKYGPLRYLTLLLAIAASILYFITLHDTLAPLALGLPNHHCPFCLFQEFPDTALFAGLFWIGIASACWRVILELSWERRGLESRVNINTISILRKISSVFLLFSIVSLISHVLIAV
ncbi:MAG: hypothetical protein ACFFDR_13510 [Candidatus Thorarchaeota archaeon]